MKLDLFCLKNPEERILLESDGDYIIKRWYPSWSRACPREIEGIFLYSWWLVDIFKIFRKKFAYAVYLIFSEEELIHYSVVCSRNAKFDFMNKDDIHIGPVYTKEKYRNTNIATLALWKIMQEFFKEGRKFWWLTSSDNYASINLVNKFGFKPCGSVKKVVHPWGAFYRTPRRDSIT